MKSRLWLFVASALALLYSADQNPVCPLRIRVTLSASVAPNGASGRLLLFMKPGLQPKADRLETGFSPDETWVAGQEFEHIGPGETVEFDPDLEAYPKPFSQAPKGDYQIMALLDLDHSYARDGQDGGDLYSSVVDVAALDPSAASAAQLTIDKITPAESKPADTGNIKLVEFVSSSLSAFWGRPVTMQAGVVLPPDYAKTTRRYPSAYVIHGFGGDHTMAWSDGPEIIDQIRAGKRPQMATVFLNGSFPTGHHVFADSVNNGPWGLALTQEFIPFLEKRFRLIAQPYARFVTGHSSGGWSSLWLQVTYPDFFGGVWSTSPDPVDFRSFTGIDVTPGSHDNAYVRPDGKPHNLVRRRGKDEVSVRDFVLHEMAEGEYGGQFASFEWVFSPKSYGGRPMELFNRVTGNLDPAVEKAWQKYDIRRTLDERWPVLGPRLQGKINLLVGSADTFHLEEAVEMLCDLLKQKGAKAVCEIVPGRDHMNLYSPYKTYPEGLDLRIAREMGARYRAAQLLLRRDRD